MKAGAEEQGDHVHRLRLVCYRLRKAAAGRIRRIRLIIALITVGIVVAAYGVLNEIYAWKLILEQECFESINRAEEVSRPRSSCVARTWERWYTHAALTAREAQKLNIDKSAECKRIVRLGHWINKDGGWDICVDDFPPDTNNKKFLPSDPRAATPCIVYSFGINNDASFDEDLVKRWPECHVYAFDPSIGRETGDTFLGPNIHFFNIGLGGNDVAKGDDKRGWQIMSLESIMSMLEHEHINLLKMDIEWSEWETWTSWRLSGVHENIGQLIGEIHFSQNDANRNVKQVETLGSLKDFGFSVFQRRLNFRWTRLMNVQFSHDSKETVRTYRCIELGWMRSRLSSR